VNIDGGQT